jgi:hypothetical protein
MGSGEAMTERPILFAGSSVVAIIDDKKIMTRRVVKSVLPENPVSVGGKKWGMINGHYYYCGVKCPYGMPFDRLWVRETFMKPPNITEKMLREGADTWPDYVYVADFDIDQYREWGWKIKPSIFMPREASRITLEIVSVSVERLQEISGVDAVKEGCGMGIPMFELLHFGGYKKARWDFMKLWDSLNGKKHPWSSNPFVWVIEFRRIL